MTEAFHRTFPAIFLQLFDLSNIGYIYLPSFFASMSGNLFFHEQINFCAENDLVLLNVCKRYQLKIAAFYLGSLDRNVFIEIRSSVSAITKLVENI